MANGDVATGMSRARQLGMLTYRGRGELDVRFGKLAPGMERPPVAEYLEHHGRRFAERFPVRTFLLLSEAIDRGSIADDSACAPASALEHVTADTMVVGVPGDMLFPWALQEELHRQLQAAGAQSSLWKLDSLYGHDAFLADQDRLAELLRGAARLAGAESGATATLRGRRRRTAARAGASGWWAAARWARIARDDRAAAQTRLATATASASASRASPCATSTKPRGVRSPLASRARQCRWRW
jgi:hypothetical protein